MSDKKVPYDLTADGPYLVYLYGRWAEDPQSVDPTFHDFFRSLDEQDSAVLADSEGPSWEQRRRAQRQRVAQKQEEAAAKKDQGRLSSQNMQDLLALVRLIHDFRAYGHLWGTRDPLGLTPPKEDFSLSSYGFSQKDLQRAFQTTDLLPNLFAQKPQQTLSTIITTLKKIYCGSIGYEFEHVKSQAQRDWFIDILEGHERGALTSSDAEKRWLLAQICSAQGFEAFCHKRFVGAKRFGLEGGEALIPALNLLIGEAQKSAKTSVVLGMAHRGRLNTLVNVLHKPFEDVFAEFSGDNDALFSYGAGDVKYHLGYQHQVDGYGLYLLPNPSHLEAVDPVVCGAARALRDQQAETRSQAAADVLSILVHGDAAFGGQGVVYETLELSQLPAYETGGTVHIVVNNQIGFTTNPGDGNSGIYCTDIAKAIEAPIMHVNGDDPEAVAFSAKLAMAYRRQFHADVVIDLVCFRRYGHNEIDEPSFTQPKMYEAIKAHPGLFQRYGHRLSSCGVVNQLQQDAMWGDFSTKMDKAFDAAKQKLQKGPSSVSGGGEAVAQQASENTFTLPVMEAIGRALTEVPQNFHAHRKMTRQLKHKAAMFTGDAAFDWATAEALALGSLLYENINIRFSGEDTQRGTFSQRHMVWFDQKNQQEYVPLNHISQASGKLHVWNSLLSEYAALGFEYGYSVYNPQTLTIWEAQFGDFVNCAQVIIDQFISAAQSKWNDRSGLVMLLPHGYEGQGPEHSSARLERFLQLCAEDNMIICNVSTPANFFHLLRRQAHSISKTPLVVMEPKSLLRLPQAVSNRSDFIETQCFHQVLDDEHVDKRTVRKLVLCTGKVYYDLDAARQKGKIGDVALVRIEQLYPFPAQELVAILGAYKHVDWIWCQEEPQNYGAWQFVHEALAGVAKQLSKKREEIQYVGRENAASPACGVFSRHIAQQNAFIEKALMH